MQIDPDSGSAITYGDLSIRVERMRSALYRIGVAHGDVMGTYAGNSSDFIIFCIAATSIGAIVTPINPAYKTYEVEKYFYEANVKWAVTEEHYFEKLSKSVILHSVQAFIFFSSGTTDQPKGAILSNRSLIAAIEIVRIAQNTKTDGYQMVILDERDIVYGVLPYFHAGGLLTVFCMLVQGVQLLINRKFDGTKFLETIEKYKVTTLNLVPPVLNFLADSPLVQTHNLSTLKHIFVGAAHVEASLLEKIKQKLQVTNMIELYGLTEAGAMIFMHPANCEIRPGSCGIPLPGVACKVIDVQEKTVCGPLQTGELWIKTSTMMSSYLRGNEHPDTFIQNGWFQTGDIGYYDEDKFFYIIGRTKETIKVRGWQVSPHEIEETILQLPEVEQCAVIGIPDEHAGEVPRAYVILKKGTHLCAEDIHKIIEEKLASYKRLTGGIEFINDIPMTASGKIARNQLLANFLSFAKK
uniref:AMP-dependent synthetase/ligase domain-containing protein n=1 Tax=Ascaris lumbricoides TaxID=6252 RepID=A0A9J2P7V6_ASCLU